MQEEEFLAFARKLGTGNEVERKTIWDNKTAPQRLTVKMSLPGCDLLMLAENFTLLPLIPEGVLIF